MKCWISSVVMIVVLAAGCARYRPEPIDPVASEVHFRARSVSDPGLQQFVAQNLTHAPAAWPPNVFDLKLLTLTAFYFHPDLEMGRAGMALAQAGEVKAGESPNPSVSILPEYSINPDVGAPGEMLSPWLLTFSWDIPIETAGKRGRRLDEAKELTAASKLAFAETMWKVRSGVRAALVEKFAAEMDLKLLQDALTVNEQRATAVSNRVELGESSRMELAVAQTDLLTARVDVSKAQARVSDARLSLASALGLPHSALDGLRIIWPDFEKPLPADIVNRNTIQDEGLLNRLDIRRSLKEYAAAEADLRLEIANQYPDIHLTPGYQFDEGQHKFSIGPSFTVPLFNQNQGAIAQAEAKRQQAAAAFLSIQAQAIQSMEKAQAGYQSSVSQWNETDALVNDLKNKIEKNTRAAIDAGAEDQLSLLNVQLQTAAAARARLDALVKVQQSIGALEDAMQRPIEHEN